MSDQANGKIDERTRRRPSFLGGRPVLLADGQEWTLPLPRVRYTPDDGDLGFRRCIVLGDGYQDLIAAASEAKEGRDVIRTELALGRFLLLANYDLTPAEVSSLLQFSYSEDDPEGCDIQEAVTDVAFGRSPKPAAGGDG